MNRMPQTTLKVLLALSVVSIGTTFAQDYTIDWHTIDGGGEMFSTGDDFELGGTMGQADAGPMSGDDYVLTGGFWATPPCWCLADLNNDGWRNGEDIQTFVDCVLGGGPGCACADLEIDGRLNMADVTAFVSDLLAASPCP